MNVYFSGIGGSGISPLAEIAHQIGYHVSGSDKQDSSYIDYLHTHGIPDIHIGQDLAQIAAVHAATPIDWLVYSSAVMMENPDSPEFQFARDNGIRISKRDEFLNFILHEKNLDLIAIAGTHGKTTTVAMTIWLFQNLGLPISYLLPAKTSFAKMGEYNPESKYFIYEADEFDRNFLHFTPTVTMISGVAYDHQEIFPSVDDYKSAFREFIGQSGETFLWEADVEYLFKADKPNLTSARLSKNGERVSDEPRDDGREERRGSEVRRNIISEQTDISAIKLAGKFNRRDAMLVATTVAKITGEPLEKLIGVMSRFPGVGKRMEKIVANLYVNYAHTPEKLIAGMSAASEILNPEQKLIVLYEPLTNRRQHYFIDSYKNVFDGAAKLYWLPTYLAREDEDQAVLTPAELIAHLDDATREIAESAEMNDDLKQKISGHLANGDMVVAMIAGGGNDSLDHWLRANFL
ncbi:Mur ligase domain-containing protein [Candidatus Saccharibacteria bacterium]|nr:Mur ligase domain-containing protein [Candidatus Saccharibacteria bacterium]MCL1963121.1 Mur ligase domain-containing protein [Candidatus Saccharibacteria bacterium]